MMAELKGIWSSELNAPELPDDPEDCWVMLGADIGERGSPGADTFYFRVCTVKSLAILVQKEGITIPRGFLIVECFDWDLIEKRIDKLVNSVSGETWEECAFQLSHYAHWEFENFQEPE